MCVCTRRPRVFVGRERGVGRKEESCVHVGRGGGRRNHVCMWGGGEEGGIMCAYGEGGLFRLHGIVV